MKFHVGSWKRRPISRAKGKEIFRDFKSSEIRLLLIINKLHLQRDNSSSRPVSHQPMIFLCRSALQHSSLRSASENEK